LRSNDFLRGALTKEPFPGNYQGDHNREDEPERHDAT
jgi:hypothetical protein